MQQRNPVKIGIGIRLGIHHKPELKNNHLKHKVSILTQLPPAHQIMIRLLPDKSGEVLEARKA
jgi:hypothetical protein